MTDYLWKEKSMYKTPWDRQFLNIDFLKYEKKRISDCLIWHNQFQKAKIGDNLDEVYYYVIPIELNSEQKAAIALKGEYNYVGLSALKNSLQLPTLMLTPRGITPPEDYAFIKIEKAKKDCIYNKKNNNAEYVIVVEKFSTEDSSLIYLDVPYEKKSIANFIKENLVTNENIAQSFQTTISSSPYRPKGKGGITFSAFFGRNRFSNELLKTLKLMQPTEFTDLQWELQKSDVNSTRIAGLTYKLSEKSIKNKNYFSAFSCGDYKKVNDELTNRDFFNGEYSFACSLTPRGTQGSELVRDILSKFVKTDVMHPFETDELRDNFHVDLKKAQKNIDEDLWLQVVNQKQLMPTITEGDETKKLRTDILNQWEIILESLKFKKYGGYESNAYTKASFDNIIRVAQAIARDNQKHQITTKETNNAFKLFKENSDSLLNNPMIQDQIEFIIPEKFENAKFNAIMAELSTNTLNIKELYENVKDLYNDVFELQTEIDALKTAGRLFEPRKEYYRWL